MPTYPVRNTKTGEEKELHMTMKEYMAWKEENPDWDKDWSKGCAGAGETGDWRDKMSKTHPGWKDVMSKVKEAPGYGMSTKHKDGYQW